MIKKHFVFSYTNLLIREIEKKNYFAFVRKIFNLFYKLFINFAKRKIGLIKNLDNKTNNQNSDLSLDKLFLIFNSDKGPSLKTYDNKEIKSHNYAIFYEKYFKVLSGHNQNEVNLISKNPNKIGFFEKFFQLFS